MFRTLTETGEDGARRLNAGEDHARKRSALPLVVQSDSASLSTVR